MIWQNRNPLIVTARCLSIRALPAADMQPESDIYIKKEKNSWNPADAENISCQKIPKYRIR